MTERRLLTVKIVHTVVWAFFATCILAIPVFAAMGLLHTAAKLIVLVLLECLVLALNRGRCPLTDVAARYTAERADNFDIFLPLWLARWNKVIFGSLFALGVAFVAIRW